MLGLFDSKEKKIRKRESLRLKMLFQEINKLEERKAILEVEIEDIDTKMEKLKQQIKSLKRKIKWRISEK